MKHHLWISLSCVLLAYACESDDIIIPSSANYFPIDQGHYVDYQVDSIFHDVPSGIQDTFSFQVRELIDSTFIDGEDRPSQRLLRYYRNDSLQAWQLRDVWVVTRTAFRAEKVEENQRFVKLAFPAIDAEVWDGNAFNTLETWEYVYADVDVPRSIGSLDHSSTARVIQRDRSNLIETQYAEEIYAREVGLVYKQIDTLKFSFDGGASVLQTGIEYTMTAIDFGKIE